MASQFGVGSQVFPVFIGTKSKANQTGFIFWCRQSGIGTRGSRQLDTALEVAEQLKRPILRMPDKEELAAMDRLIMEVASPRTKRALSDYHSDNKVSKQIMTYGSQAIHVAAMCAHSWTCSI